MDVRKRIPAGTLIESVVAMVLVSIAFGLAVPVFTQVARTVPSLMTFKKQLELDHAVVYGKQKDEYVYDESDQAIPGLANIYQKEQEEKFNGMTLSCSSIVLKPETDD